MTAIVWVVITLTIYLIGLYVIASWPDYKHKHKINRAKNIHRKKTPS